MKATTQDDPAFYLPISWEGSGDYRDILYDSEINGIKQKDLAEKYGITYPTLRSTVQRGRAKLKAMLDECCKIETDNRGNVLECTPREFVRDNCEC